MSRCFQQVVFRAEFIDSIASQKTCAAVAMETGKTPGKSTRVKLSRTTNKSSQTWRRSKKSIRDVLAFLRCDEKRVDPWGEIDGESGCKQKCRNVDLQNGQKQRVRGRGRLTRRFTHVGGACCDDWMAVPCGQDRPDKQAKRDSPDGTLLL